MRQPGEARRTAGNTMTHTGKKNPFRASSHRAGGKRYRTPELVRYGALRDLTAGGSANAAEDNAPCNPPGCNPDENKRKP